MKGLISFALLISLASCGSDTSNNSVEKKPAPKPVFFFYPKPNVYLDTVKKTFFYFDSSQKKWINGNPPVNVLSDLGKSVLIDSAPQPVWSANVEHRLIYGATLYADSTDFKEPPPKEPKVVKKKKPKTNAEEAPPEEKPKTRLGELIDRIFKGKNKDKKN